MIDRLVLDIETVPLTASLEAEYPRGECFPPANYKNPEAIDGWHVKNAEAWRQKRGKECSVNPRLGRVLCLGTTAGITYATTEADERDLLLTFWSLMEAHAGDVVTWNGAWDLNFLLKRSMIQRVPPTVSSLTIQAWFKRYVTAPHFDCKAVVQNWDSRVVAGEGLDEWAEALGLEGKAEGVSGGDVAWLFDEGQHALIQQYCAQDVATTQAIYQILATYYGV